VTQFAAAAGKLADNAEFIRHSGMSIPLFVGLFSYDGDQSVDRRYLQALKDAAGGNDLRIVDHVSVGSSRFIKYWPTEPTLNDRDYDAWHLYNLREMAVGYFLHNLLAKVCRDPSATAEDAWFPRDGKEVYLVDRLRFRSRG
jgi:hypothetical protein